MTIKTRILLPGLLLLSTSIVFAQKNTAPKTPATPPQKNAQPQKPPAANGANQTPASQPKTDKKPDKGEAYYHFALAHMYEEMMSMYGRSEYATKAIEEYRLAIENDPSSEYLNASLAELYAKTGRIRDAVLEAQDIIKRDPNNLEAHKLLARSAGTGN
jgi:predicted Zn-dependent protease